MKMETEDALDQLEPVIDLQNGDVFDNQVVMNAYNQLVEHQEKIEKKNVKKLASNLKSLYEGSAVSGIMRTLSKEIFSLDGMTDKSTIEDITVKLEQLNTSYEEAKSEGTIDELSIGTLSVFTRLIKYKPFIVNDLPFLASNLKSMYLGSQLGGQTAGLMSTLASKMFSDNGRLTIESDTDEITAELERLKISLESAKSGSEDESNEVTVAFSELILHSSSIIDDLPSLADNLKSMYLGSQLGGQLGGTTTGLMSTLASKIFGSSDDLLDYGSDLSTITAKLGDLNSQFMNTKSEEGDIEQLTGGNEVFRAFVDLVNHKPSIAEDLSSLAIYINHVHLSCEETYQRNLSKLREYIRQRFSEGDVVFVRQKDDVTLNNWWTTIIGLRESKGGVPGEYGIKKVTKGMAKYDELENIGVCFDLDAVQTAINKEIENEEAGRRKFFGVVQKGGGPTMRGLRNGLFGKKDG